jgi:hypothetical protein
VTCRDPNGLWQVVLAASQLGPHFNPQLPGREDVTGDDVYPGTLMCLSVRNWDSLKVFWEGRGYIHRMVDRGHSKCTYNILTLPRLQLRKLSNVSPNLAENNVLFIEKKLKGDHQNLLTFYFKIISHR